MCRRHSIILALLVACAVQACDEKGEFVVERGSTAEWTASRERIRAVVLDAREAPSDSALAAIRDLGASHLALVSFGFQQDAGEPTIRFSPDVRWYSESRDGVRTLADRAAEMGMGIVLKPQIWLRGGAWTAEIDFESEQDWMTWEKDYRAFLLHTARLADEVDAEILIIGTELSNPVQERPEFWRKLIADVRAIYDGRLTYGANWHDDYLSVPFWDALDFIGVQAYFPIAGSDEPSLPELRRGWNDPMRSLEALSARSNKPILFTEVGYRSVSYAAREPWRWPSRDERAPPDFRMQSDLFTAFFESVWLQPWFAGAVIWKFYPADSRRARERDLDFSPQTKPAEEVIRRWFRRRG